MCKESQAIMSVQKVLQTSIYLKTFVLESLYQKYNISYHQYIFTEREGCHVLQFNSYTGMLIVCLIIICVIINLLLFFKFSSPLLLI
jgi:ribosomal protein S2